MDSFIRVRKKNDSNCQSSLTTHDLNDFEYTGVDLSQLKEVSERLNLSTRRPSTTEWKQVIEYRKSIGLYSSDVEPEFLDNIVEAKMRASLQNSPLVTPKLPGKCNKSPRMNHESNDDINNNTKEKSPRQWRSKTDDNNDESKVGLDSHKKEKSAAGRFKSIFVRKMPKDDTKPEQSSELSSLSSEIQINKNVADVVTDNSTTQDFFEVEDEFEEDITGLSEMGIRYYNITKNLGKIRKDLIMMRMEDNKLARDLLDTRSQINILKLEQSCDEHAEMLDDATYELEEEDMLPGLIKACDLPSRPPGSLMSAFTSLRSIGVSRMNLNRRRFSIR